MPTGRVGGLVLQLRRRGHVADVRAVWILVALIATILVGLAYYIGVPIWEQYVDGRRGTFQVQLDDATNREAGLATRRNDLRTEIITAITPLAEIIPSGTEQYLFDLLALPDGMTLLASGWGGAITRSTDAGENWGIVPSGTDQDLTDLLALPDGTTLLASGEGGAITRSTDAGASWGVLPSGTEQGLFDLLALPDGKTLLAAGGGGVIMRISDDKAQALAAQNIDPVYDVAGESETSPLQAFWDDLPPHIRDNSGYSEIRSELVAIDGEASSAKKARLDATAAREKLDSGTFDAIEKQVAFEAFFESCTAIAPSAGQTKSCTDAWTAQQLSEAQTWWQTLATSVPQGILLLFLLATLSGLYRYNLRIAGFHHSRADALELLATSPAATDIDTFVKLADTLAADKVSWGKGNTPADQAMEIIKALVSRKPE